MELLSKEIQLEWLQTQKETLETLVNLEMERKGKLDLITREELKEALGVSGETLRNWEMMGYNVFKLLWRELEKFIIAQVTFICSYQ